MPSSRSSCRADPELALLRPAPPSRGAHDRLLQILEIDLGAREIALAGVDLRIDLTDQVLGALELDVDRDLPGDALTHRRERMVPT